MQFGVGLNSHEHLHWDQKEGELYAQNMPSKIREHLAYYDSCEMP